MVLVRLSHRVTETLNFGVSAKRLLKVSTSTCYAKEMHYFLLLFFFNTLQNTALCSNTVFLQRCIHSMLIFKLHCGLAST